jgi:peptide/nickel transport system permease protein
VSSMKVVRHSALQLAMGTGAALYRLKSSRVFLSGAILAVALVFVALLAPVISPYPHDAGTAIHLTNRLAEPSIRHPFGTDDLGRDILSRVLYGAGVSLRMAILVLSLSCAIGVPLGIAAGYFGGLVDSLIMRITDVFLAFPSLLLALAIAAILGPSIENATLAIAVSLWPWYTRIARGQAASVAGRRYIESCVALAIPRWRILARHVLPNSITPIIVQVSLDVGGVILVAAALSFLGLGAQDPTPEWGLMVNDGQTFFPDEWWLVTFPGAAILFTAMAFNLLGDGLRDLLDPRRVISR